MRRLRVPVRAGSVLAGIALGLLGLVLVALPVTAQGPESITISLDELNDSGISGTATLTANDGSTEVTVELVDEDASYPMHIHANSCDEAEVAPTFPLADGSGAEQTSTLVNVSLSELLATPYSIIVHQPTTELSDLLDPSQYVACGNITAAGGEEEPQPTTEANGAAPTTGIGTAVGEIGSDRPLLIGLVSLAALLAAGGFALRRREARF